MNVYNPIAYPLTFSENPQRERLEYSNQVLLPPEILQNAGMDWFANNQSNFPAFFNLKYNGVSVNVGVLEFLCNLFLIHSISSGSRMYMYSTPID